MTQDPYGQPPGTGYVVRGEIVPDDEANVAPPAAPTTQFQKVASALRGDRTDPAMPAYVPSDAAGPSDVAGPPDAAGPSDVAGPSDAAGPSDRDTATSQETRGAAEDDATRPEEVVATRSPDTGSHDYWDDADEAGQKEAAPKDGAPDEAPEDAAPDEPAAAGADVTTQDPTMAQPDLYGTATRAPTETAYAETDTADAEPGAATTGASEAAVVGKHAGASAQEGLRPGESDHGLGDFSDLTYGSLLPDAAEFKAQWQQVQYRFVDDPQSSVTEAADVVAQVTAKLEAAIAERQRAIAERQRALRSRWSEGKSTDTESLRETLLMYRAFLEQLTGPKDS